MSAERRSHARVAIPLDVRAQVGGREEALTVREVSQSGIFLYCKEPWPRLGMVLKLKLSIVAGIRPILVEGQVIRIARDDRGKTTGIALRFLFSDAQQAEGLMELVDRAMNGRGTGPRAFPRVSYLLQVRCTSDSELEGLLRDIGEGGAGLELPRPVDMGSEVLVELEHPSGEPFRLGGFVTTCSPEGDRFRVGVRFHSLTPESRQTLSGFLRQLYRR